MIERHSGILSITCDTCADSEDADTNEWNEAWEEWKELGWRSYKKDGEWMHSCPDCVDDWAKGEA